MSDWKFLNANRSLVPGYPVMTAAAGFNGTFYFSLPGEARRIHCLASDQAGWEHVSVSFGQISPKPPSWELMCRVKDLFWDPEEAVIQIHPPRSQWVNFHPGCLHLWRCTDGREQPLPPSIMVGKIGEKR